MWNEKPLAYKGNPYIICIFLEGFTDAESKDCILSLLVVESLPKNLP